MLDFVPWYGFAFFSMAFMVIKSILEKRFLTNHEETAYVFAFYLVNVILVVPLLGQIHYTYSPEIYGLLLLNGAISALVMDLFAIATKHLDLSCVSSLKGLSSVLTLLLAWLLLGEILTPWQGVGLLLVFLASYLFLYEEARLLHQQLRTLLRSRYFFYLLLAIVMSVITALLDRKIITQVETTSYLVLSRFTMVVFAASIYAIRGHLLLVSKQVPALIKRDAIKILPLAVCTLLIAYTYYAAISFEDGKIGLVTAIRNLSVIVITLFGGWYLQEKGLLAKTAISGVVVIGLLALRF